MKWEWNSQMGSKICTNDLEDSIRIFFKWHYIPSHHSNQSAACMLLWCVLSRNIKKVWISQDPNYLEKKKKCISPPQSTHQDLEKGEKKNGEKRRKIKGEKRTNLTFWIQPCWLWGAGSHGWGSQWSSWTLHTQLCWKRVKRGEQCSAVQLQTCSAALLFFCLCTRAEGGTERPTSLFLSLHLIRQID